MNMLKLLLGLLLSFNLYSNWSFNPSMLLAPHNAFLANIVGANNFEQVLLGLDDPTNQKLFEKQIFDSMYVLAKKNQLSSQIQKSITLVKENYKLPQLEKMDTNEVARMLEVVVMSELYGRGYYNTPPFRPWEEISFEQQHRIGQLPNIPYFNSDSFKRAFKTLTGSDFLTTAQFATVKKNSEALNMRLNLIDLAKNEICMSVWGFYDDVSGQKVADKLIEAYKRGVNVRIIVDGLTARRVGYNSELKRLQKNGIELIYWQNSKNPFFGLHAKFLIVDKNISIEGGRNIGDHYLQEGEWSDLDIIHTGDVGKQNYNLFVKIWNQQIELQKLKYSRLNVISIVNDVLASSEQTATVMHFANAQGHDPIYETTLYAISQAKKSIKIANAYVINTPGLKKFIGDALARGVKVEIISNSPQSIDEPMISIPIVRSLKELADMGAKIYLKQGTTLHTKLLIVDNDFAWVGSYNLHPRSFHYEIEKIFVTLRKAQVAEINIEFGKIVDESRPISITGNWNLPEASPFDLFFLMFFNQL